MKNLMKPVLVAFIAVLSFVSMNEAKAQLQIESAIGTCTLHAEVMFSASPCGALAYTQSVLVETGNVYVFVPPGAYVIGMRIYDGNGGINHGQVICPTYPNFATVGTCTTGSYTVQMDSDSYIAVY